MENEKVKRIVELHNPNEINQYLDNGWQYLLHYVETVPAYECGLPTQIAYYHLIWTSDADPWYPQEDCF